MSGPYQVSSGRMKAPPQEIERKFLVDIANLPKRMPKGERLLQAYLSMKPTVRIRIVDEKKAYMTVKGEGLESREEIEFRVPLDKARYLVDLSPYRVIHKTRCRLRRKGFTWEVDFFEGELKGLVTAEVELDSPEQKPPIPDFLGEEVTKDSRFGNSSLAQHGLPSTPKRDSQS